MARLRLRHSQHWLSCARPSCPKHSDDPQAAPRSLVLPACWLRAVNLHRTSFQGACAPYARQTKRSSEIIGVACRALGGRPGQRLMTTCTRRRENLSNTLCIVPKLRQNRFKYSATLCVDSTTAISRPRSAGSVSSCTPCCVRSCGICAARKTPGGPCRGLGETVY